MGGRERRREHRAERRDRAVHQADQPWLDDLQNEAPLLVLVFAAAGRGGQDLLLEPGGDLVVLLLLLGQVAEQLAGRSVGGARQGLSIEARRGALHLARMRAHRVDAQGPLMPHWLQWDVTADVIAPYQGNMIAEFRNEEIDEPASMAVLLRRHLVEDFCACRVIVVQAVGEIGENARVLLLIADGEGQNLALGQVVEFAHRLRPQDSRLVDLLLYRGPSRRRALERGLSRVQPAFGSRRPPEAGADPCLVLISPRSRSRK